MQYRIVVFVAHEARIAARERPARRRDKASMRLARAGAPAPAASGHDKRRNTYYQSPQQSYKPAVAINLVLTVDSGKNCDCHAVSGSHALWEGLAGGGEGRGGGLAWVRFFEEVDENDTYCVSWFTSVSMYRVRRGSQ